MAPKMANALRHEDYTVGWICALDKEMTAARAMLEREHANICQDSADTNSYILGNIGPHNIAIACLPWNAYGISKATSVATNMRRSFKGILVHFMVGIGGGIPHCGIDLRLGDIVVGEKVIQYDLGKAIQGGVVERTGVATHPPPRIATALTRLRSRHGKGQSKVPNILRSVLEEWPGIANYARPDSSKDQLFRSEYAHATATLDCAGCDAAMLVDRRSRLNNDPRIHYKTIASGNLVIKDSFKRDEIGRDLRAACVEMEAAGLTEDPSCLVVRGICDYADSHKNDQWQEYAALVAAAYVKDLLSEIAWTRTPAVDGRLSPGTTTSRTTVSYAYANGKKYALGANFGDEIDPLSHVDVMKSFGLDASKEARRQYAEDYGIEGTPFTRLWGDRMRLDVLRRHGRLVTEG